MKLRVFAQESLDLARLVSAGTRHFSIDVEVLDAELPARARVRVSQGERFSGEWASNDGRRESGGLMAMQSTPPPLVGFNNNVRYRGMRFHIQTEDSGVTRPHIITHLFADGGRVIKSLRTDYAEYVDHPDRPAVIHRMMRDQHRAIKKPPVQPSQRRRCCTMPSRRRQAATPVTGGTRVVVDSAPAPTSHYTAPPWPRPLASTARCGRCP